MALAVGDEIVAAAVSNEAQIDRHHITIKSFGLWDQFKTRSFLGTFREMCSGVFGKLRFFQDILTSYLQTFKQPSHLEFGY